MSSVGTVQKYAGTGAAVVLLPVAGGIAFWLWPFLDTVGSRFTNRQGIVAAGVFLTVLAVGLVVIYPHANTHSLGTGSDRDDAANLGAHRLLHGEYPYGPLTYLGGPISQQPGALALAVPFVAAFGSVAYANVFWIGMLIGLVVVVGRRLPSAVVVVAATMVFSPGVLREFVTGGDLIGNAVYVAVGAVAVYKLAARRWAAPLAAVGLGLALASRANFALILIPLLAALLSRVGRRRALGLVSISALVALALFAVALAEPAGRRSIRVSDHLNVLGQAGAAIVVVAALMIAIGLAARQDRWSADAMLFQVAAVQVVFPLALIADASEKARRLDFSPLVSGYGVPALLLAVPCALAARHGHSASRGSGEA